MHSHPAPLIAAPLTLAGVESSSDWDVACREGPYQSERTSCGLGRGIEKRENAVAGVVGPEAAERLVLDWSAPIRHQTFYKAVFRPAVARANRLGGDLLMLPPGLKFHALRHTYASLCVAAGIPPLQLSRFMGHAKVTTTLAVYTHLFDDDHAETMAALEAMSRPASAPNVVPIRRRS